MTRLHPYQKLSVVIHTSACQQQNQHPMVRSLTCIDQFLTCHHRFHHVIIRSLACKVLFLTMQGSVPSHARFCSLTCKVLFIVVHGSVPSSDDLFSHKLVSVPTWNDLSFASHDLYHQLSLSSCRPRSEYSAHLMISAISSKMASAPWHMDTATSQHKWQK